MNVPTARFDREFNSVTDGLIRDLQITLGPLELRGRLAAVATGQLPSTAPGRREIDAFVCHSSQDKECVARPLADELKRRNFSVWLDEYELTIGKSVYSEVDRGLRNSRYGVVILSPSFFERMWPQNELHALAALGAAEGRNKILPVWHSVSRLEQLRSVRARLPSTGLCLGWNRRFGVHLLSPFRNGRCILRGIRGRL